MTTSSINSSVTSPPVDHNNFPIYCSRNGRIVCSHSNNNTSEDESGSSSTTPLLSTTNSSFENSEKTRFCRIVQSVSVEPWILIFAIGHFMELTVVKNVILEKLCLQSDFNISDCMNTTNSTIENYLQVKTSTIEMYTSVMETIPCVVLSLFLGSYGDRRSRKVTMIIPMVGALLSAVIYSFFSYFMQEIPVEYMPLAAVPRALTGGSIAAIMSALSFVAHRSEIHHRTLHVAAVEVAIMLGMPLGALSGGYLYRHSYTIVFITAFGLFVLALLYILIFIHDDPTARSLHHSDEKWFSFKDYKDTFFAFFKARDQPYTRAYILALSATLCFNFFLIVGKSVEFQCWDDVKPIIHCTFQTNGHFTRYNFFEQAV